MILVTVAAIGATAGILGLTVALVALGRAARMVDERDQLVYRQRQAAAGTADGRALRDLAVMHYDALKEMSGQLSFSLALLNAAGDGIVLTSINGRTETRTYAKVVEAGDPVQPLSPEEKQVLRAARLGQGPRVWASDDLGMPPLRVAPTAWGP